MRGVSSAYKGLNEAQQAYLKALQDQQRASLNLAKAEKSQALETEKLKIQKQLITKATKQAALEELGLISAYDRTVKKMNEAGKSVQNLTAKKAQGIKLSDKEQAELRQSSREFRRYQRAVLKADASIGRFQRNVGNYPKAIGAAISASRSLASALGLVGGAFLAVSVARNAIKVVRDFEKQNATLASVLQVSKDKTAELRKESVRLGSTTVKTSGEVTALQIAYARLGFSQQEIIDLTEGTINGSIAMNAGLEETAELTGAVVNTFDDFSSIDAPKILDIMSLATAKSALNFSKLQTGIPIVAGAANAAGIPFTKLVALMGKLSDSGIDVSSSSTALRNIFIESAAKGLNYEQILEKIKGSQDKLTASNDEFGKRAAVSATVLSANIDATNELDEALQSAADTSQSMAEKELDTLDGALKLLKSAWEGYVLGVDESEGATDKLKRVVQFLARNLSRILDSVVKLGKGFLIYKGIMLASVLITKAWSAATALAAIRTAYLKGGIRAAKIEMKAFNTVTKANPLVFLVSLLATATAAYFAFRDSAEAAAEAQRILNEQLEANAEITNEKVRKNIEVINEQLNSIDASVDDEKKATDKKISLLSGEIEKRKKLGESYKQQAKQAKKSIGEIVAAERGLVKKSQKPTLEDFKGVVDDIEKSVISDKEIEILKAKRKKLIKSLSIVTSKENEKARKERLKASQKLAEFELKEQIKQKNRIIENEDNSNFQIVEALRKRVLLQMELERLQSEFAISSGKLKGDALILAEKKLQSRLTDIIIKGQNDIDKARNRQVEEDDFLNDDADDFDSKEILIDQLIKSGSGSRDELEALYDSDRDAFLKLAEDKLLITERYSEAQKQAIENAFAGFNESYGVDSGLFAKLFDDKKNTLQDYVNASTEAARGLYNSFQTNYDKDLQRIQENKERSLEFAGDSEEAKKAIETKYDKEREAIQKKQAKQEKDAALFNIFINTARGVTAALTSTPPNVPLSVAIGAIGLAQAVKVSSKELPAFWAGGESPGGQILVNDDPYGLKGGGYREVVQEPSGKLHFPQGKNVKMSPPKGSIIYPNYSSFNAELERVLSLGTPLSLGADNAIHRDVISINNANGITANQLDSVMKKHMSKIQVNNVSIDKAGVNTWISEGVNSTILHNNIVEFKGRSV